MTEASVLNWLWAVIAWVLIFILPGAVFCFISGTGDRKQTVGDYLSLSAALLIISGLLCARLGVITAALPLFLATSALILFRKRRASRPPLSIPNVGTALAVLSAGALAAALHYGEIFIAPAVRGGFFYLSEIKYFLEAGAVPSSVMHFAARIVPQVDKFGFDVLGTLYFAVGPADPLVLKKAGYLLTLLVGCACVFELFRKFSSLSIAAAAAVFIYADVWFGSAPALRAFFIPESLAFVLLLISARQAITLLEGQTDSNGFISSALTLAVCAAIHLEIAGIAAAFFVCVFASDAALCRSLSNIALLVKIGLLSFAVLLIFYLLLGIAPGFLAQAANSGSGADLSWSYFPASDINLRGIEAPQRLSVAALIQQVFWENGLLFRNTIGAAICLFLFVVSTVIAVVSLKKVETNSDASSSQLVAFAAALQVLLLPVLALITNAAFDSWVYRTEVLRRLIPYLSVFLLMQFAAVSTYLYQRRNSASLKKAFSVVFAVLSLGFHAASYPYMFPVKSPYTLSAEGITALRWLETATPKDAIVLSNIASNGAFHVLAGRPALTEGHQPMLRPALVAQTIENLRNAQKFFENPNENFLISSGAAYVIVSRGGADFGGTEYAAPFEAANAPSFLCSAWKSGHIEIYRYCPQQQLR